MSEQNEQRDRLIDEAAVSPPEDPVTVGIFYDPASANLARMALDASGIPSFLQGENANNLIPLAFSAQLQVRPEDEAAARQVLESPENDPESMEDVTAAEAEGEAR
jgi:hypothetical protein